MDRKLLRILMVTPFFSPNIGGVETHLDDLCTYLRRRGHEIHVITYQPLTTRVKAPKNEREQNFEIRRINCFGYNLFNQLEKYPLFEFIYLTPLLLLHSLLFFLRYGKKIDVIHVHGLNAAFIAKMLTRLFAKRSVVSIHAIYELRNRPLLAKLFKWVLSSSDVVLAASQKTREDILATGLPENKVKTFVHWVDQDLFRPLDSSICKKELGLEGMFVILFVGRFIEKKGVRLLFEVASKMNLDGVVFAFIGNGPLANEIRERASKQANIKFVGKVTTEEIVKYYNAAEFVIVPSLYNEPLGRVILEALSCGVPVLASNVGGIPEVLNPFLGVVFKPNVDEIGRKTTYFYFNRDRLQEISNNCRSYAKTYFSEKNAEIIEKNYK